MFSVPHPQPLRDPSIARRRPTVCQNWTLISA